MPDGDGFHCAMPKRIAMKCNISVAGKEISEDIRFTIHHVRYDQTARRYAKYVRPCPSPMRSRQHSCARGSYGGGSSSRSSDAHGSRGTTSSLPSPLRIPCQGRGRGLPGNDAGSPGRLGDACLLRGSLRLGAASAELGVFREDATSGELRNEGGEVLERGDPGSHTRLVVA